MLTRGRAVTEAAEVSETDEETGVAITSRIVSRPRARAGVRGAHHSHLNDVSVWREYVRVISPPMTLDHAKGLRHDVDTDS
jgi:hypothetical protein